MRLINFDKGGQATLGILREDEIVDLSLAAPSLPRSLRAVLEAGALDEVMSFGQSAAHAALSSVRLLAPITDPSKIICLGLNYVDHAAEGGHAKPEYPSFFMRGPSSLVAHGDAIVQPKASVTLDYEAELVAIVGKPVGRHVALADALQYIAGYSCFNDGSIREYQRRTSQWTIGKNFDGTGGFGPAFVTADELPPGATGLRICSRLNGDVMQDANTSDMLFPVAETVSLLSQCMTLVPGDLLVMGTPAGVGHARTPPVWMKPGDVCEIEIEQVGLLSNPIVAE
ncbi:MAG: fumarylacetoacetate hydrolase family protein [Gammaproteobacteria bacterium]|nr:fumarylacetoacetate hydrolase family protein [Gammaproteobacteria bacterium]